MSYKELRATMNEASCANSYFLRRNVIIGAPSIRVQSTFESVEKCVSVLASLLFNHDSCGLASPPERNKEEKIEPARDGALSFHFVWSENVRLMETAGSPTDGS